MFKFKNKYIMGLALIMAALMGHNVPLAVQGFSIIAETYGQSEGLETGTED
jgi:hypothetical protein